MMAVTNRHLCDRDFLEQIEFLASTDIDAIILREKDMTPDEYEHLAKDVLMICHEHHKKCILHSFAEVAAKLNCENIHLPLPVLMELSEKDALEGFKHIGTSVHSVEDALVAEKAGATCLTAGDMAVSSSSPIKTFPEVGRSSKLIHRTNVDLPAPEKPMMPNISPFSISRLTSFTAANSRPSLWKTRETCSNLIN